MSVSDHLKEKLRDTPHKPGVYLHKDQTGGIIYVGKARDLKKRLSQYFTPSRKMKADRKTRALMETIADFDYHVVRNEEEALVLEAKLIKQYRPRYNVIFRDDKRFQLVRADLTSNCPRIQVTRIKKGDKAKYFGPFVHAGALQETLSYLNHHYGLRTCSAVNPTEKDYRHCNADVIQNCSAPCIGKTSPEDYQTKVAEAVAILEGKGKKDILADLDTKMQDASKELDFEAAAKYRDIKENLVITLRPTRQFRNNNIIPSTIQPLEDLAELGDFLGLSTPPSTMECFDISNVSSNHIVASMVRFQDGSPDNNKYRRYRIKTVKGQDDFASMAEVVRRRYSHLLREGAKKAKEMGLGDSQESVTELSEKVKANLPDLIIVDGGKGQLSSAVKELQRLGLYEYQIIGLAKREEEVYFPGQSDPLKIPHDKGALKLLQRIRDEAHRFANNYNELLLRKRIKESLLDDCPGVSPRKKDLLLQKFGSVTRVKKASAKEISTIHGISEKGAISILEFLNQQ